MGGEGREAAGAGAGAMPRCLCVVGLALAHRVDCFPSSLSRVGKRAVTSPTLETLVTAHFTASWKHEAPPHGLFPLPGSSFSLWCSLKLNFSPLKWHRG